VNLLTNDARALCQHRYFDKNNDHVIDRDEFHAGMRRIRHEEGGSFLEHFLKLDIMFQAALGSAVDITSPRSNRLSMRSISSVDGEASSGGKSDPVTPRKLMDEDAFTSPAAAFRDDLKRSNFRKLHLLGYGGIGKVYLVACVGVPGVEGMLFAMKVVKKASLVHRNKARRILMERDFMSAANHPFICTLYASFQTNRKLYFVTQYCAGGEFFRLLQQQPNRRLSENAAKFYAAEILLVRGKSAQIVDSVGVCFQCCGVNVVGIGICSLHGLLVP